MTTNPQELLPRSLGSESGQRWLVVGLGREGRSSWNYLAPLAEKMGAELWLADEQSFDKVAATWPAGALNRERFIELGMNQPASDQAFDLLIKTPGIPGKKLSDQFGLKAKTITSNTGLFFELIELANQKRSQPILTVGVTGTKGKSTTTAITHQVLEASLNPADGAVLLAGNIGLPALDLAAQIDQAQAIVLELSSHQLADMRVSPQVAIIQTIVPEHQDHFADFEEYSGAKANLVRYQKPEDLVLYFADNATTTQVAQLSPGRQMAFGLKYQPELTNQLGWLEGEQIVVAGEALLSLDELKLVGRHNLVNVLPSLCLSKIMGWELGRAAAAARDFAGLPHRLQLVRTKDGVTFYNDTLATNPEAASAALRSFPKGKIILLAGGYDRHPDYTPFAQAILDQEVKEIIFFPPSGAVIAQTLEQLATQAPPSQAFVESMAEAVQKAAASASPDDIILLSPGSPSFGLFKDYADRGDQFISEVQKL